MKPNIPFKLSTVFNIHFYVPGNLRFSHCSLFPKTWADLGTVPTPARGEGREAVHIPGRT